MTGGSNTCLHCQLEFGGINERGRQVKKQASGLCSRCYNKVWSNKEGRTCLTCGGSIIKSAKLYCSLCHEMKRDEKYKLNPKKKIPESLKKRKEIIKELLDRDKLELIRRLLAKFKSGLWLDYDLLRVADIYIEIYDYEARLDAYGQVEQVKVMLKRLSELWQSMKVIEALESQKPGKKKRGRPYKV